MYIKAIQTEKDGKVGVAYYRGKKLWCRIVQYDDGCFHALTNPTGGSLVPTLELAKQRIEEHIRLIDSMAGGKRTRITYDYRVYGINK